MSISCYFSTVSGAVAYWIFAVKYWSIATKIELALEEKDTTMRNSFTNWLLFGGIVLISFFAIFSSVGLATLVKDLANNQK